MATIDDLTNATTALLTAVNVQKATLDQKVTDAGMQAAAALAQANNAATNAAAVSAVNTVATNAANNAQLRVNEVTNIRDAVLSAWGAATTPNETLAALSKFFHAGNVVAAFIYDTSKDSDGGVWRNRCRNTSWWSEAINNNWIGQAANELSARYTIPNAADGSSWIVNGAPTIVPGAAGYFENNGTASRYLSAPDSALNSVAGDIDLRIKANLVDWTPATTTSLFSKWGGTTGSNRSFSLEITNGSGRPALRWGDATTAYVALASIAPTVADGADLWLRATMDVDNGAGGNTVTFYTSNDGITWTQLGTPVTAAGVTSILDSSFAVEIGSANGGGGAINGKIFYAEIRNGIDGTLALKFDGSTIKQNATNDYYQNTVDGKFYKLNATTGQTEVFRGQRRDFPATALIVAEAGRVIIYDGDTTSCPMWTVFVGFGGTWGSSNILWASITAVAALNGIIGVTSSVASGGGITQVSLIADIAIRQQSSATNGGKYFGNIENRNANRGYTSGPLTGYPTLSNPSGNDLAMIVLPEAPIDIATGLPVPTIAVATDNMVSVLKHDGTISNVIGAAFPMASVNFDARGRLLMSRGSTFTNVIYASDDYSAVYAYNIGSTPYLLPAQSGRASKSIVSKSMVIGRYASGLNLIKENPSANAKGMAAFITTNYNTGWMPGDIRGAWLMDIVPEVLGAAAELIANGGFDADLSGWTVTQNGGSTVTWNAGTAVLTGDGTNSAFMDQSISTEIGKSYNLIVVVASGTGGVSAGTSQGNTAYYTNSSQAAGTLVIHFTATTTTTWVRFLKTVATSLVVDSVSCKRVVGDRVPANGNGLSIVGSLITKTAVAAGAQLMGYGGYNGGHYLEQPYNSKLDFGTGEFFIAHWVKCGAGSIWQQLVARRIAANTGIGYSTTTNGTGQLVCSIATGGVSITGPAINDGQWHLVIFTRVGGVAYVYLDGAFVGSTASTTDLTVPNSILRVGMNIAGDAAAANTSMALLRLGATGVTADQARYIYETEKKLFEVGAQCTIDGTSSDPTGLSYDDAADTYHAVTSWGRSTFQNLTRIESAASTSVGTPQATAAAQGGHITAGTTGARYVMPSVQIRDALRRREDAKRAAGKEAQAFVFTGNGSNTVFALPRGFTPRTVHAGGVMKTRGTTGDRYGVTFDGFVETVVFLVAPGTGVDVVIMANRSN